MSLSRKLKASSPVSQKPIRHLAASRVVFAGLLLLGAMWVAYWNSFEVPFQFDDEPAVRYNATIRRLGDLGTVLQPPAEGAGVTGRPVVNLSLAVNYALGGLAVRGYHLMNVALHGLVCLMLWAVLRRTLEREVVPACCREHAGLLAWGITLVWAVHPLLTETVVCVVQRNEILAGLFYLLTLYGFIRAAESPVPWRWQVFAVVACALGMASKEVVATAPLMVWLYDRTFVAGSFRATGRRKYFYAALAATWAIVVWLTLGNDGRAGTVGFDLGVSSWAYLLTQCRAVTIYLGLSFWPHPLVVDYGTTVVKSVGEVWAQGLLVLGLLGATSWALWRRPIWGFISAWFFVILAPSSSFVPLTTQTIAEHRMYLPLVAGIAVVMIAALRLIGRRGLVLVVVGGAVGLGWATVQRNVTYQSELALWTDTVNSAPLNQRARLNQGQALFKVGRFPEAAAAFAEALRLKPNYAEAHYNLGLTQAALGQTELAVGHFREALQLVPDYAIAHNDLGIALAKGEQWAEAQVHFESALRLRPDFYGAHFNLGSLLLRTRRPAEAIPHFLLVLTLQAESAECHSSLALALMQTNRQQAAIAHYEAAVRLRPESPELRLSLALSLAATGQLKAAIPQLQEAVRLQPDFAAARHYLGQMQADLGKMEATKR